MEKAVIHVPKVYADHHVEAARNALLKVAGVKDVIVSSAWKHAVVGYEPAQVTIRAIHDALRAAGYGPDEEPQIPPVAEGKDDESGWFGFMARTTQTSEADRQMSGEFRKH